MTSGSGHRKGTLAYLVPSIVLVMLMLAYLWRDDWMIVLIADFADSIAAAYVLNKTLLLSLWLTFTWMFLSMVRIFFWEGVIEARRGQKVPVLLINLFRFGVFLVVGVLLAITVFDMSALSMGLLIGGSAAFVAVFFRDFLAELFAGLSINLDQNIDIGFHLELPDDTKGVVQEMTWRSVTLKAADGSLAVVPNTLMAQQVVKNLNSLGDKLKVSFSLTLDFSLPVDRAVRVLNAALTSAAQQPGIAKDPMPEAYADGPGTFGVIYHVVFHFHSDEITEGESRSRVTTQVMRHLMGTGLTIALPKQNVFIGEVRMMAKSWERAFDRESLLANIALFKTLDDAERKKLAASIVVHNVPAGTDIIRQGDTSTSMYGLAEGVLEVSVENDGQRLVVAAMEPGNFFGEMSMLADEPRSATVTALVDSMIFELHRESFSEVLGGRADLAESISRVVVQRQMSNDAQLRDASRKELDDAIDDASTNLLGRIRSVFSTFRQEG